MIKTALRYKTGVWEVWYVDPPDLIKAITDLRREAGKWPTVVSSEWSTVWLQSYHRDKLAIIWVRRLRTGYRLTLQVVSNIEVA